MASHHHLCHNPTATTTFACHCCYATYTPCHHHHPPPQPYHHQNPPQHYFQEERPNYPSVASLHRRIATLESALRRYSSHSLRDSAARTIQTYFRAFLCRRSRTLRHLKDLAAIKSALSLLRSSLSKRSAVNYNTLYHKAVNLLLRLDAIQGSDPMIRNGKTSLSIELNKFLDLIDGFCVRRRMGISSRVNVKSRVSNSEMESGNLNCGSSKGMTVDKIRKLVERIDKLAEDIDEEEGEVTVKRNGFTTSKKGILGNRQVQPKVKKSVSFAEDGKFYRVLRRPHKPLMEEYCDDLVDDGTEVEDSLCRERDEIGVYVKEEDDDEEVVHSSKKGSLIGFDVENSSRGYLERKRVGQDDEDEDGLHEKNS